MRMSERRDATKSESTEVRFAIHIIESPSPDDFLKDRQEGRTLRQALELGGLHAHYYVVVDRESFSRAIEGIRFHHTQRADPVLPMLHLSAHGNRDGIALTSEEHAVSWHELGDRIAALNHAVGNTLVVCMSSCEGFAGFRMAHRLTACPYAVLVGPTIEPTWSETFTGFQAFYHNFAHKRRSLPESLRAMNHAAGFPEGAFALFWGDETQRRFQKRVVEFVERLERRHGQGEE
jgi:hypothetical protein